MSAMRKLRRSVIHARMRTHGERRINKRGWFANNWREEFWNVGFIKKA